MRDAVLGAIRVIGAALGYVCLAAFVYLIALQLYRWFRDGEWTRIGMTDGLRAGLLHCCVRDGDVGRLAPFLDWLDSPVSWLGLHKVLEVVPASLALFAASILGNFLHIYARDRIDESKRSGASPLAQP